MENYYEILHIANFAEIEVVKAAYKAMTKLYHPDVNHSVDKSIMIKINLAYEVLGNIEQKNAYDIKLKEYLVSTNKSSRKSEYRESSRVKQENNSQEKREPKTRIEKAAKVCGKALWFIADSFMNGLTNMQMESERAYLKGSELSDSALIKRYLKSSGATRHGYSKVLMDRSLLIYDSDGQVRPSYEFKRIAKYLK